MDRKGLIARHLLNRPRTSKNFILVAAFVVSVPLFVLTYLSVSSIYNERVREDATGLSELIAQQTFSSMCQIMRRGWSRTDVEKFLASVQQSTKDTSYLLNIYRGDLVEALFGKIDQPDTDAEIEHVFSTGGHRQVRHRFRAGLPCRSPRHHI